MAASSDEHAAAPSSFSTTRKASSDSSSLSSPRHDHQHHHPDEHAEVEFPCSKGVVFATGVQCFVLVLLQIINWAKHGPGSASFVFNSLAVLLFALYHRKRLTSLSRSPSLTTHATTPISALASMQCILLLVPAIISLVDVCARNALGLAWTDERERAMDSANKGLVIASDAEAIAMTFSICWLLRSQYKVARHARRAHSGGKDGSDEPIEMDGKRGHAAAHGGGRERQTTDVAKFKLCVSFDALTLVSIALSLGFMVMSLYEPADLVDPTDLRAVAAVLPLLTCAFALVERAVIFGWRALEGERHAWTERSRATNVALASTSLVLSIALIGYYLFWVILLSIAWKDMVYPPQWNSERTEVLRDDAPVIIANWYLFFLLVVVLFVRWGTAVAALKMRDDESKRRRAARSGLSSVSSTSASIA